MSVVHSILILIILFQDFGLPLKMLKKGIEYYHEEVEVYPIWLCPAKAMDVGKK